MCKVSLLYLFALRRYGRRSKGGGQLYAPPPAAGGWRGGPAAAGLKKMIMKHAFSHLRRVKRLFFFPFLMEKRCSTTGGREIGLPPDKSWITFYWRPPTIQYLRASRISFDSANRGRQPNFPRPTRVDIRRRPGVAAGAGSPTNRTDRLQGRRQELSSVRQGR